MRAFVTFYIMCHALRLMAAPLLAPSENPADVGLMDSPSFSFSSTFSQTTLDPLKNVRMETSNARGTRITAQDYEASPPSEWRWGFGFQYPFSLKPIIARKAGLTATTSGPYSRLTRLSAQHPYQFQLLRYQPSRLNVDLGTALEIVPDIFFLGAGVTVHFSSAGNSEATLSPSDPSARTIQEVGLGTSLNVGTLAKISERQWLALVFRQEVKSYLEQSFTPTVQLGDSDAFSQPVHLKSTSHFVPQTIGLGWQYAFPTGMQVALGVDWEFWSRYEPPFLIVTTSRADGSETETVAPAVSMSNTWNPRVAIAVPFSSRWFSAIGYQYRPTPVDDLSGETNILDSDTHSFSAKLGYRLPANAVLTFPVAVSLAAQYHWITERSIQKASAGHVGSPGYSFSGNSYLIGITMETGI